MKSNLFFITTKIVVFLFLLEFSFACVKSEGVGGSSSITGKILIKDYNSSGTLISEYYAQDEDVFIIYGDEDEIYDDKMGTGYDGAFEFRYLNKGDYQIYVYSDCSSCPTGQDSVVITSINIDSRNQNVVLPDIIIIK